jgi:hypothetical protein
MQCTFTNNNRKNQQIEIEKEENKKHLQAISPDTPILLPWNIFHAWVYMCVMILSRLG